MIRFLGRYRKPIALLFVTLHLGQFIGIADVYALTSGPTQPEVQGFQPAGTTEMVDLFSGDFGYNIPLFELPGPNGGYPFNLSYQAGVTMDQEASFVGLGWSLNPGTINRQMRGLPDEFDGDSIYTRMSIDPNVTVGLGLGSSIEIFGGAVNESRGFSVYQNSYRGIGYSIDYSVGFGKAVGSGMTAGVGLNLSVDSKEGVNIAPSLSLGNRIGSVGLGAGYNSKAGLMSVSATADVTKTSSLGNKLLRKDRSDMKKVSMLSASSQLTLAHPGYTPQITMAMKNLNLSATFKVGGAWWGVYPDFYLTGYYNEQRLMDDGKRIPSRAFGYLNYQKANEGRDLMDFNREKDGMVSKETPNLAIPSLTYDIYSVTGQGMSAMYRPMRNEIGVIRDQETESVSAGGSAGVDIGVPSHFGVNLAINHARSISGAWNHNFDAQKIGFKNHTVNSEREPWYFKIHGEPNIEPSNKITSLGGNKAVRVKLTSERENPTAQEILEHDNGFSNGFTPEDISRRARNQVITPITNRELLNGSVEMDPLYRVKYFDNSGELKNFSRQNLPLKHPAGYTAISAEGLRYVYAIPAYNLKHEEVTFSAKKQAGDINKVNVAGSNGDPAYKHEGTDKFFKRVEIPQYAHSYLLTSIVGPDYVDVTGDGLSEDDLGYWVKFTYQKTTTENDLYKWRDPFSKAHYQEGWKTDPRDDRGSYTYGEKELWYLAKAETKSHLALFTLSDRADGKGVTNALQDSNLTGKSSKALSQIKLYTRKAGEAQPIKVIKLEHDYSLCKNVYNGTSSGGKLTLKKLWFEYGGSDRGKFNPYVFNYHENIPAENPDYNPYDYDRWGNYKPNETQDPSHNIDFPYSEQDPSQESEYNSRAAAWCLKEIKLPSGGKVIIDYESDDYGYVQHKQAMQMTEIVNPAATPSQYRVTDDNLKIRFKLEKPISAEATEPQRSAEALRYIDQEKKQVYFKLLVNLKKAFVEDFYEYVSAYAEIDLTKPIGLEKEGGQGNYVYGFFHVKPDNERHPFSMRAWQHLRTNQPDLTNRAKPVTKTDNTGERINQIKKMQGIVPMIRELFEGYYKYCSKNDWGREIIASKSWVRLNSPDKKKYGGGLRVRQITMMDNWQHDQEGVYGQVYDYTTVENGETISSGVAAYEPFVGGDENALRYAKKFTQSIPLRSDNNLYFEYPINESYYPGPQVGYRKVTVTSLAAASLLSAYNNGKEVLHTDLGAGKKVFPMGGGKSYGTTGSTVHEFYTAKDFPVITDETVKQNRTHRFSFAIPPVGPISIDKLTSSQGYSIVTNDMHGRLYKVSNYRQARTGKIEEQPISWVKYNYASDTIYYQGARVLTLRNEFKQNNDGSLSLIKKGDPDEGGQKFTLGQENEFFLDSRQFEDRAVGGGASYNTDILYFFFAVVPLPSVWANMFKSEKRLRTLVTNKVIFKSGIQTSTEAYDGGSTVLTENRKWDKLTGGPVLTVVNNDFDASIFTYSMLAYKQYEGMGAAYQNIGLRFEIANVGNLPYHDQNYEFTTVSPTNLFPGDEILLYKTGSGYTKPLAKVTYTGIESGDQILYSDVVLPDAKYEAMIIRSGFRNQLSVSAGSITALTEPTGPGTPRLYSKTITLPKR